MSQAHYGACFVCAQVRGIDRRWVPGPPVARVMVVPLTRPKLICKPHLDLVLDGRDARGLPDVAAIEWVYDAGTRFCSVHHWPADLCSGWTHNRRTLDRPDPWRSAIGPST